MIIQFKKRLPRKIKKWVKSNFGKETYMLLKENERACIKPKIIGHFTENGYRYVNEGYSLFFLK